ncbi:MAG: hypothetical protein FD188_3317, partial [Ignavibacteria bacterium]
MFIGFYLFATFHFVLIFEIFFDLFYR